MTEGLDKLIRDAIGTLITTAFAAADPPIVAKVYPWNVLSHQLNDWPGLFTTGSVIHGWVIKGTPLEAERKNAQRDRVTLEYDIWGFYEFRSGKSGDNSDDEFAVIRAKVYNAIKAEPRLDLENEVEYHELLQFARATTIDCGETTLHFAQGKLTVHLCC
jgi:hypothetical protein